MSFTNSIISLSHTVCTPYVILNQQLGGLGFIESAYIGTQIQIQCPPDKVAKLHLFKYIWIGYRGNRI